MFGKVVIKPLKKNVIEYAKRHGIEGKLLKAAALSEEDNNHPSLNVELLEPRRLNVYSFRVDRK